jgi:hypothetical protein
LSLVGRWLLLARRLLLARWLVLARWLRRPTGGRLERWRLRRGRLWRPPGGGTVVGRRLPTSRRLVAPAAPDGAADVPAGPAGLALAAFAGPFGPGGRV